LLASPLTFPCPSCKEIINDSMTQCRFCSAPVDPGVAQLIAERQQKANQAYSDASFLRTAAIAMYVFLGLNFIPFLPLVSLGFFIIFIVAIVLLIRWQIRYGGLQTDDADYQSARRSWTISLFLTLAAAPIAFIIRPLFYFLVLRRLG